MGYLHGVEVKETVRSETLSAGDSSIIALVGTAPSGEVGKPILITSLRDGWTTFGSDIGGFTIPAALGFIFTHATAKVIVINVLDNADAAALLEEDGKMTVDEDGNWATNIYGEEFAAAVDYSGDIISSLNLLLEVEDNIGIKPNLIIVPGYSQLPHVAAKMVAVAQKLNGFAIIDQAGDSVQSVVSLKSTSSPYAILGFPEILRYNDNEQENQVLGLSVAIATAKAITDSTLGYWISPSNLELAGILGTKIPIRSSLTDETADTNLLNGGGIVTVLRRAGSGYRVWGNWTAGYPIFKTADVMIAPRAVKMMIREVLIDAALSYLDRNNITKLTVEMIQNDVNAFLRSLIGAGAINSGECKWDAEKNPSSEISQGKLLYTISVTYGPSLDKLTFDEVVDTNYQL